MSYSIVSILALILNFIINREALRSIKAGPGEQRNELQAAIRYRFFLIVSNCYFVADIGWGILYEHHESNALFPFLYSDCVLYFIFMFLTMLAWIRYVVAYLNRRGRRSKAMLYAVWFMFALALIYLMVNRFHPFIFSFNANHEYIPEPGRHIAYLLQIALYVVTSTYMLYIAHKSIGRERGRYIAVGLTCVVMELFLILQILNPLYPFYAMGLLIGICVIHSFVELGEKKEKEIYDSIARGLAEDYAAMYYIDIETGEFQEYVASQEYRDMNVPIAGRDFYAETQANIEKFVHPDDWEVAKKLHQKETMLSNLEGRKTYSYKYRLIVGEESRFFLFTLKLANDGKHFVLYEKDIEDDIKAEALRQETEKKQVTFTQIAESLAVNYDVIYYVDAEDSSYISYECRNIYGQLDARKSGDDYYEDCLVDVPRIVYPGDREQVYEFLNKDHLISTFKDKKSDSIEYRVMAGDIMHYVRLTARKTSDGSHYIIGIENIDDEVRKEKQHLKALNTEKELARRDELTGVKNKTAYHELEKSVQENINNGLDYLTFALIVCDANNLKRINDTEGHVVGDEYIKNSAKLLCDIFVHSPVFRVGGDEFVVFLRSNDFTNRDELMKQLRERVLENLKSGSGPILASGMAEYDPKNDTLVSEIFDRADKEMYEDKQKLKGKELAM